MIKKILFVVVMLSLYMHAQNKIMVSVNPGCYLYNSENSMHITDDHKVGWSPGVSVAYEKENMFGYDIRFEYNFMYSEIMGIMQFVRTGPDLPEPIDISNANYFLTSHNFDLSLVFKLSDNFNVYAGPSLAVYNRTFDYTDDVTYTDLPNYNPNLYDKLVSYCVGINGGLNYELPLSDTEDYFFFYSGLKIRYLHSFYFDKRGRNTDNYYQSILTGQMNIGIGYSF